MLKTLRYINFITATVVNNTVEPVSFQSIFIHFETHKREFFRVDGGKGNEDEG